MISIKTAIKENLGGVVNNNRRFEQKKKKQKKKKIIKGPKTGCYIERTNK